jgi:putative thiamine transport system permease protein
MLLAAVGQSDATRSRNMTTALGYGKLAGFAFVLWPQLYKQIRVAIFAVLAFSASVVDVSLILGPSTPPPLSVVLVRWMNDPQLTYRFVASAGALLQLGLVLVLFGVWLGVERLGAILLHRAAQSGRRYGADNAPRVALMTIGWALTLSVIIGVALLGVWSIAGLWTFPDAMPHTLNMNSWARALPSIGAPLLATFIIGFTSAFLATLLCILCLATDSASSKTFRLMGAALSLPLIVPQTAFLFGLQVAALKSNVGYGYMALVITHLVFVLPYVFLSLAHPFQSLDKRYVLMALALGKSHTRALFDVQLPLLLRPIITAFAVGFAVSVGLYLPTLLIGAGRIPTITTEAIALASGGNRRTIGVYAFLQSIIPFTGFALAIAIPAWFFRHRAGMRAQ